MIKPELLSPAGSVEKLRFAVDFGADAVYIGAKEFGLRTAAENADFEELQSGISYAHQKGVRVYITTNVFPRSDRLRAFPHFLSQIREAGADALIVSDMGIFSAIRENAPDMEIHLSTQANCLNDGACRFYHAAGAKRIVLARELSLEEISYIRQNTPDTLELEVFVHGAMCISYSGRCLLSNYMTNRDANRGNCAHTCRWNYALVEEKRPGEYYPIEEDDEGTYILNSKDLCLIDSLEALRDAGVASFKIEGRVKSEYYVASVTAAYRRALDLLNAGKPFDQSLLDEVKKVSHRDYFHGFLDGSAQQGLGQRYSTSSYIRDYEVVGYVQKTDGDYVCIKTKNPFAVGDTVEFVEPRGEQFSVKIQKILNADGESLQLSNHPESIVSVSIGRAVKSGAIMRKEKSC